jgi:hypothetical protein
MPIQELRGWRVTVPEAAVRALQPSSGTELAGRLPLTAAGVAPSLSVVIPYYRGAATIRAAVESVLAQTVQPAEIVICDDGSPDSLVDALGDVGTHVRIVRQANRGIAAAMNAVAEAASGDFLVQLDQDDAFLPRRLEAIAATLSARPDVDVVATDAHIELDGEPVTRLQAIKPFVEVDRRKAILETCFLLWPAVRRSLQFEIGGYDVSFAVMQDWELFARLILADAVVAFVHEPLYRWRLTPGSRSSSDRVANVEAIIKLTSKLRSHPSLKPEERELAGSLLEARRRWLAREQARLAIEQHAPDARRRSLRLLGGGFDRATRIKAAVALTSPTLARRFIERRREHTDPAVEALARRGFGGWSGES